MELHAAVRAVLAVLAIAATVNVILAQRAMLRLQRDAPALMRRAGILKIDWWWGCLRGMFRLGLLEAGKGLSSGDRWIFRGMVLSYAWLLGLSCVVLLGLPCRT